MSSSERRVTAVSIEVAGMCNASCPYCAQRRLKLAKHKGKFISLVLFEQILDHLRAIDIISKVNPPPIQLYSWGEPFLHPEINSILKILKEKKLYAQVSSNFIVKPDIEKENLSVIDSVTFSLSGFTQESYKRIHGASLKKVLENFDSFYKKTREYSPKTIFYIAWHRYSFNEEELWSAYEYFNRPGITFSPAVAYLVDLPEMLDFVRGKLSGKRKNHAETDLFLNDIRHGIDCCAKASKDYHCPGLDFVILNESGQLMICCCVTSDNSDNILGNILKMSAEEIWKVKSNNKLCQECTSYGLAQWFWNQRLYNKKPLPAGGGLCRLKLWSSNVWIQYYGSARARMGQLLLKLPMGESLISALKSFERKLI